MSLPQTEIVQRAERLATELTGGPVRVEKNVLLSVVADFLSDPRADVERLRKTLRLLKEGSGGHLERSGSYAQQVKAVANGLGETLADHDLSPDDLKSLFGWTARLLLVRGVGEERRPVPASTDQRGRAPGPKTQPRPEPAKRGLGSLGKKSLSALEKLRADLEKKEKG
jgi:hypothetical protein